MSIDNFTNFKSTMSTEEQQDTKRAKLDTQTSEMSSKILQICTHSGSFHADESLAVYMLKMTKKFKDAKLVRSRDPKIWEESDIVVDVSGKYDGVKFFDHHQREFNESFNDKFNTKLSSAGLVFKHFGKDLISENLELNFEKDESSIEFLYQRIYKDFIEAIDANDNGINKFDDYDSLKPKFSDRNFQLSGLVSNLNPSWETEPTDSDFDKQFEKASEIMGLAFINYFNYIGKSWLPAKNYVLEAFNNRFNIDKSGKIIVIERFVPWKEHLFTIENENNATNEILYVLFPDSLKNWRIAAVPISASSFDNRLKLPEPWRGLRDDELSEKTGIPDCVFIHAAGFIGGAKTREAVIQLAKDAVNFK